MKQWKQALIAASAGASVALFLQRKKTGGLLFAGVSLAAWATEHAEKIEALYERLPDYLERGSELLETASLIGAGVAKFAEGRGMAAWDWDEVRSN
jgi:hypothetical protein